MVTFKKLSRQESTCTCIDVLKPGTPRHRSNEKQQQQQQQQQQQLKQKGRSLILYNKIRVRTSIPILV